MAHFLDCFLIYPHSHTLSPITSAFNPIMSWGLPELQAATCDCRPATPVCRPERRFEVTRPQRLRDLPPPNQSFSLPCSRSLVAGSSGPRPWSSPWVPSSHLPSISEVSQLPTRRKSEHASPPSACPRTQLGDLPACRLLPSVLSQVEAKGLL